eukprot:CAMPEP_0185256642 /NCGR_PEP_ID=MMETSP1359-20130426/5725_1 /TAXON_ID=552665 /ORGANISM="Bigelowiella longifila, Strain CCMP242" /LENGTH=209 /DNA_ID=CAMNT_0027841307 /DNA_START=580 /DNA_END=1209 /DNA_ORIENTATION=-
MAKHLRCELFELPAYATSTMRRIYAEPEPVPSKRRQRWQVPLQTCGRLFPLECVVLSLQVLNRRPEKLDLSLRLLRSHHLAPPRLHHGPSRLVPAPFLALLLERLAQPVVVPLEPVVLLRHFGELGVSVLDPRVQAVDLDLEVLHVAGAVLQQRDLVGEDLVLRQLGLHLLPQVEDRHGVVLEGLASHLQLLLLPGDLVEFAFYRLRTC